MLLIGLVAVSCFSRSSMGQTNVMQSGGAVGTNGLLIGVSGVADFYRLQYYYAARTNSHALGTETNIFTVTQNGSWNNDWNSLLVPKPTRSQLKAITAEQLDLFRLAAVFTNSAWEIITLDHQYSPHITDLDPFHLPADSRCRDSRPTTVAIVRHFEPVTTMNILPHGCRRMLRRRFGDAPVVRQASFAASLVGTARRAVRPSRPARRGGPPRPTHRMHCVVTLTALIFLLAAHAQATTYYVDEAIGFNTYNGFSDVVSTNGTRPEVQHRRGD